VRRFLVGLKTLILTLLLLSCSAATAQPNDVPIEHIIVFYQENHTFDNVYGHFQGANGLERPGAKVQQVNKEGKPYRPCRSHSTTVAPTSASQTTCPTPRS
jgi:phospholipase C